MNSSHYKKRTLNLFNTAFLNFNFSIIAITAAHFTRSGGGWKLTYLLILWHSAPLWRFCASGAIRRDLLIYYLLNYWM